MEIIPEVCEALYNVLKDEYLKPPQGLTLTFWCTGPMSSLFRISLDRMQVVLARCKSNSSN